MSADGRIIVYGGPGAARNRWATLIYLLDRETGTGVSLVEGIPGTNLPPAYSMSSFSPIFISQDGRMVAAIESTPLISIVPPIFPIRVTCCTIG